MDNEQIRIIRRLSLKYGLPERVIKEICHSQFEFAYKKMKEMDLKQMSDEEVKEQKTNFRFRFIGTLYIPDHLLKRRKNKKEDGDIG